MASTFALSTLVRRPRRPRASSNARRTTRRISPSVYQRVSIATRPFGRLPLLRRPSEVEARGELADDQQVDALEDLGADRRGRHQRREDARRAAGSRTAPGPHEARTAPAPGGPARPGRPSAAHRRRRGAPRGRPRIASRSSDRSAVPYASIATPPATTSSHSIEKPSRAATASSTFRPASTTSGPTPSPAMDEIR